MIISLDQTTSKNQLIKRIKQNQKHLFKKETDTYSYKAFILKHILKTFLNKLVCSTNKIKIVYVIELHENNALVKFKFTHNVQFDKQFPIKLHYLRSNPGSKKPTSSTRTDCPCLNIFRITPHQITKWPLMRNFTVPLNDPYLS